MCFEFPMYVDCFQYLREERFAREKAVSRCIVGDAHSSHRDER